MIYKITASLYIFSTILISHYPWGTKYNKMMAAALFLVAIIERLRSNKKLLELSPQHVIFVFWALLATFSGIISGSGEQQIIRSLTRVSLVFLASLPLYMLLVDRLCFKWISWTFVFAAIASSAVIQLGIMPPPSGMSARFEGTLANANRFGFVSLIGLVNTVYLWQVYRRPLVKVLLLVAGALLSYQIILSGSRKGMLGVFFIFFLQYIFYVFKNRKEKVFKRSIGGLVVLSIVFSIFSYFLMTSDYGHRLRNMFLYIKGEQLERQESSLAGRTYLMKVGFNNFMKSPIIGSGMSSFDETDIGVGMLSRRIGAYAHSNFIEVLSSSGTIGFILYYSIYLTLILKLLRQFKYESNSRLKPIWNFAATSIVLMMFYELFSVTYYGKAFWIVLSCILASVKIVKDRNITSTN
jgi:O-antigen ligase